ncbi:glycosyltransferase family 4 protein [Brachymonas chironomi]|uniref:glycosyltransferase family 4 protein n=1 Tax=Brachymonas chironomi TaxID=491919 RepID=UPI000381D6E0|nr:glycosyltransferase family 4 protein [Brachymonas chironomi]
MNILYLNHYAGSPRHGMEYRPYYLAREWVQAGHAVRMLAADFSHVRTRQPDQAGTRHHELIDGIDYHWYPTPVYAGNGLGRVKNIWRFLRQVWREADRIVREFRPDIVIASSTYPMDIWVAHRIVKLARQQGLDCRLVFEVHDLWPLSPIELGGMSSAHPFIRLCQTAENYAYRHADVVVSMLPKVAGHMQDHGLDLRKLHIVPNGITLDEWQGNPPPLREDVAQHMRACKQAGLQLVGYAGSHGTPNALDVMLQAAALLRDAPLAFVLVGDGHEKAALQAQAQQLGLQNVAFFDPIPKAQIPSFLAVTDIAYIGWQRVSIYRFGIAPNKLMDYMMARCVVLHSVEAGNDPVAEAGCGITVPPADPAAIADGLRQLAALDAGTRARMGDAGRQFVLEHHTYPVLARRFLQACA